MREVVLEDKGLMIITRQALCRLRRGSFGMTQKEYAERCGISVRVLQKIESNKPYNPRWSGGICLKIFGVTWDWIFDHCDWLYVRGQTYRPYEAEFKWSKRKANRNG